MPSQWTILRFVLIVLAGVGVQGIPKTHEETVTSTRTVKRDAVETLPHDAVDAMPRLIPAGMDGKLYLAYQPRLKVLSGCVPFPAVDEEGNIGRGLQPSGPRGGRGSKCNWSPGQIYVRSAPRGQMFALLYTWYQPKDQTGRHRGTRHDWEGVILYIKDRNATDAANIFAVCPSTRGTWFCSTSFHLDGTFPLIKYGDSRHHRRRNQGHTCDFTDKIGEQQPLVAWESMPEAAKKALSQYDYGWVQVPFIDAHFNGTLALASPPAGEVETLPHDKVVSMPQLVPAGVNGTLYATYQPKLTVLHGCVPFPAVDLEGRIGRGLKPSGESGDRGSRCGRSHGQVYVRSAQVGNLTALLYTWYQPKDQIDRWGKRHDWEGALVYIKNHNATDAANVFAVCPSALGTWRCSKKMLLHGTSTLIEYGMGEYKENTCFLSHWIGEKQPLVAWESMPTAATQALSKYDFGRVAVPFIDANFDAILALAVPPS